ncbi:MAG: hypothetical protein ACU0CA_17440 [Paracoccaceae bacterium]
MAGKLKEAMARNTQAAAELDAALRACLGEIRDRPDVVVEGRFRVITGGRRAVAEVLRGRLR